MLVALGPVALMVAAPMALAAVRTGTDAPETLTGTKDNDRITGWGGTTSPSARGATTPTSTPTAGAKT